MYFWYWFCICITHFCLPYHFQEMNTNFMIWMYWLSDKSRQIRKELEELQHVFQLTVGTKKFEFMFSILFYTSTSFSLSKSQKGFFSSKTTCKVQKLGQFSEYDIPYWAELKFIYVPFAWDMYIQCRYFIESCANCKLAIIAQ